MSKTKVQKPYVKPQLISSPTTEAPPQASAVVVKDPVADSTSAKRPEGPKVRYCRITTYISVVVDLPHDPFCIKSGRCFCEMAQTRRVSKTLHLVANIPQIVPVAWVSHDLIQSLLRSGKALVKYL